MADETVLDLDLDARPAFAELDKLETKLEKVSAALTSTAGLIGKQLGAATAEFAKARDLIAKDIDKLNKQLENPKLSTAQRTRTQGRLNDSLNQSIRLSDRELVAGDKNTAGYVKYGPEALAKDRQSLFLSFKAELNKQQQQFARYMSTLRLDIIKGEIDAIRSTSEAGNARLSEELFKAQSLIRRNTQKVFAARGSKDQESLDRIVADNTPVRRTYRDGVYSRKIARQDDPELQAALIAQQTKRDEALKFDNSLEGITQRQIERDRKEAIEHNKLVDSKIAADQRYLDRERRVATEIDRDYNKQQAKRRGDARALSPEDQAAADEIKRRSLSEKRARAAAPSNLDYSIDQQAERAKSPKLLGIQAQYLANYAVIGGLLAGAQQLFSFMDKLEQELKQFQAISASTNYEMVKFTDALLGVSNGSKFSAVEVAQAATTMAQAGLSLKEVQDSLGAVVQLATASGSTLQESVDLVTSVLGTFNLQSSQTVEIANVMTEALNRTKLTVDKLALGVQYAGNVAADAGVSYTELTAILGALSNTGVRSGSTLGTGLRQLFVDIQKPSENFQKILKRIGLTVNDVNIRTQGFAGVLSNLQKAGFSAGDALDSFEVRAASAFTGLSNNKDQIPELIDSFTKTSAAADAAGIQMEGFSATFSRLGNNIGSVAYTAFSPFLELSAKVFKVFADLIGKATEFKTSLAIVGTALAGFALGGIVAFFAKMAGGLLGISLGAAEAAVGLTGLAKVFSVLRLALIGNPILIIGGLIATLATAAVVFQSFGQNTAEVGDKLKGLGNEVQGQIDSTDQSIKSIRTTIHDLNQQSAVLADNPIMRGAKINEVKNSFRQFGIEIDSTTGSIGELIDKLTALEAKLQGRNVADFAQSLLINGAQQANLQKQINDAGDAQQLRGFRELFPATGGSRVPGGNDTTIFNQTRDQLGSDFGNIAAMFLKRAPVPKDDDTRNGLLTRATIQTAQDQQAKATLLQIQGLGKGLTADQQKQLELLDQRIKKESVLVDFLKEQNDLMNKLSDLQAKAGGITDSSNLASLAASDPTVAFNKAFNQRDQSVQASIQGAGVNPLNGITLVKDLNKFLIDSYKSLDDLQAQYESSGKDPKFIETAINEQRAKIDIAGNEFAKQIANGFLEGLKKQLAYLKSIGEQGGKQAGEIQDTLDRLEGPDNKFYRQRVGSDETQKRILEAAQAGGVSGKYALGIAGLESNFDPKAVNKSNPNFRGLYQFSADNRKAYGLTDDSSIEEQTDAFNKFTESNRAILKKALGSEPTNEQLAVTHFAGAGDGVNLLRADRSARADSVGFGGDKLTGNNLSLNATVGDVIDTYVNKYKAAIPKGLIAVGEKDEALLSSTQAGLKSSTATVGAITAQSKLFTDPDQIRKMQQQIKDEYDKQVDLALKQYDEQNIENKNSDLVKQGRQDVVDNLRAKEDSKLTDLTKQIYKKEEDQVDDRVKRAENYLKVLQTPENAKNTTPQQLEAAQKELNDAQSAASVEKYALAQRYLAETQAKVNELQTAGVTSGEQYTQALGAQADAETKLKEAQENRAVATTKVKDLDYANAANAGTHNFLKSSGVLNEDGSIKSGASSFQDAWTEALSGVSGGLDTFTQALVTAPKNAGQAFKAFGASAIDVLIKIISKALVMQTILGLFGDGSSSNTGLLGGSVGDFGSIFKGLFSVGGMATGGKVTGGVAGRDSVLKKLMPGEVVLNTRAVKAIGEDNAIAINNMGSNIPSESSANGASTAPATGTPATVNVWVISPDQQPTLGPNDVIAIVGDNIQNKGTIKQLIKTVQVGGI